MAELRFPVRDREDDLAFDTPGVIRAAISQGKIDETEGSIVRELCMRLLLDGCRIFGEAEDRLEAMGPRGQREILDRARVAVGLNTIADEEAERRFQVANSFPGPLLSGIDLPDSHSMTELRGRRAANARWKERAA